MDKVKVMRRIAGGLTLAGLVGGCLIAVSLRAYAYTQVLDRYDQLSTNSAGATATNTIGFVMTDNSDPIGSIEFQFCQESPLPGDSCTTPTGFSASNVSLTSQTGNGGFSVAGNSTVNAVILTRSPAIANASPNTYVLSNIVNPSGQGTYYLRISTYPTTDASGAYNEFGGVALSTSSSVTVNSIVPPYLDFCVGVQILNHDCATASSYLINFGDFSSLAPSVGTSQFVVATNAGSGYTVYLSGSTLTSGTNVIANMATPQPSLDGASQFGMNLTANTSPAVGASVSGPGVGGQVTANYDIPNRFVFNNGDTIATSSDPSDYQTYTVSYLTNISPTQPAGVYATTLTYICLANF